VNAAAESGGGRSFQSGIRDTTGASFRCCSNMRRSAARFVSDSAVSWHCMSRATDSVAKTVTDTKALVTASAIPSVPNPSAATAAAAESKRSHRDQAQLLFAALTTSLPFIPPPVVRIIVAYRHHRRGTLPPLDAPATAFSSGPRVPLILMVLHGVAWSCLWSCAVASGLTLAMPSTGVLPTTVHLTARFLISRAMSFEDWISQAKTEDGDSGVRLTLWPLSDLSADSGVTVRLSRRGPSLNAFGFCGAARRPAGLCHPCTGRHASVTRRPMH
jgi:hypothetical protein